MTSKERIERLIEQTRNGEVVDARELGIELRLMLQSVVCRIRQLQINLEENGQIGAIPGQLISEFNKLNNARERWDLMHADEDGDKLPEGTYGSIFEDSDGNPVDSEWTDNPTVGEA